MTIAQSTTAQAYQLRKGGARARLAILRMIAADSVNNFNPHTRHDPADWRAARDWKLSSWESAYGVLSRGSQSGAVVWYSHAGEVFREERDAGDIVGARSAPCWHTDTDGRETAYGIVARLPHGRFLAGYRWDSNDERVYFPGVFTDETDAAYMASEHARVFADVAREDSERFEAAQALETGIEENLRRLRECIALRHRECMGYVREEVAELCESIRTARETLRTDFAGVL